MQTPIWQDPGRGLEAPLGAISSWGKSVSEMRQLIGWLGNTVQQRRLAQISDEELMHFVERDRYPVPTPNDREGYWGENHLAYWLSGLSDYLVIAAEFLPPASSPAPSPRRLLDFGCASGRVLRHFAYNDCDWTLHGTDINVNNVQWIRQHLPSTIIPTTNVVMPPLPFADESIHFAYAFSVFTHIDAFEEAWLLELRRVLKPGASALLTIHTERTWPLLGNPEHFMHAALTQHGHVVAGREDLRVDGRLFLALLTFVWVSTVNEKATALA